MSSYREVGFSYCSIVELKPYLQHWGLGMEKWSCVLPGLQHIVLNASVLKITCRKDVFR